jgi:opacity protein-like surface antigen
VKRLILSLAFFISTAANAAVVYLKDGSQMRGTVVSATARDIKLQTPDGVLTIAADRIRRVDYSNDAEPSDAPAPAEPAPAPPPRSTAIENEGYAPSRTALGEGAQTFFIGLGLTAPLSRVDFSSTGGGTDSNGDAGLMLGTQYNYYLTNKLAAGFNVELMNRSATGSQSLVPDASTDVSGNSFLVLATLKYSLLNRGAVRPYVLGGVGANRTSTVIDATPNPGGLWCEDSDPTCANGTAETRTLVDERKWGLATTARFGLDFVLADPALFSLEFGWTGMPNSSYSSTQRGKELGLTNVSGNLDVFTVAAKWGWRF